MRIALIKQDVYQDLYIGDKSSTAAELLFSSIMRVGPFGLLYELGADFYIVKETDDKECQIWKEILPEKRHSLLKQLKTKSIYELTDKYLLFFQPGSKKSHADYSVDYQEINFDNYDCVITLNVAVPTRVVKKFPNILWCYMIGEANKYIDRAYFGYDVALNQNTRGIATEKYDSIDFSYTFVSSETLENALKEQLGREAMNNGIYAEVNCVEDRPVKDVKHFNPLMSTGHTIVIHHQNILENLTRIYDSKYFVKVGGRKIRGNSVIEAISLGTLVLMSPDDLIHCQLIPKQCWVYSIDDVKSKIAFLDKNEKEYQRLLEIQRSLLQLFVYDLPLNCLFNAYKLKQQIAKSINRSNNTSKIQKGFYYIKKVLRANF